MSCLPHHVFRRIHRKACVRRAIHAEQSVRNPTVDGALRVPVEEILHRTLALLLATVADERRTGKPRTGRLAEIRARLEAFRGVLPDAVLETVEDRSRAFVETRAKPVGAAVALVAVEAVLENFFAN